MASRQAVVTGIGVVSPAGVGRLAFWNALLAGRSLVRRVEVRDVAPITLGAPGPPSAPAASPLDRHIRYALAAADEAVAHADLDPARRRHAGVVFGTTVGGAERIEAAYRRRDASPDLASAFCLGSLSAAVGQHLGLHGVNLTLSTGCAAGLDAIGTAADQIEQGRAVCVVTGASDVTLVPIVMASFAQMGTLSDWHDKPTEALRPFDRARSGLVLGEGAAAFVLEEADHARRRRQPILARVRAWSSVCSGYHMTHVREDGRDLARAVRHALQRADLAPVDIDLIDAHGTSTRLNDVTEAAAIAQVFGETLARRVPLTAQKSVMGHALGASNVLELAGLIQMLVTGVAPPIANLCDLDPECPVGAIAGAPVEAPFTHALKLSSSFSGIHSALIVSRE